jgi:hypothetical protein
MSFRKVCYSKRSKFEKYNDLIAEFEIVPNISEELNSLNAHLGSKYDAFAAFLLNITYWFRPVRWFLINIGLKPNFYCGNFVRQVDKNNKIESWKELDLHWVSPDDLLNACEKDEKEFLRIK